MTTISKEEIREIRIRQSAASRRSPAIPGGRDHLECTDDLIKKDMPRCIDALEECLRKETEVNAEIARLTATMKKWNSMHADDYHKQESKINDLESLLQQAEDMATTYEKLDKYNYDEFDGEARQFLTALKAFRGES